ncbi:MAG: hypothetical protein JSS60_03240 [Verrucomicrobia bacterium]|nr:hypothetical protein [Verrucomicrobiota bacterium]
MIKVTPSSDGIVDASAFSQSFPSYKAEFDGPFGKETVNIQTPEEHEKLVQKLSDVVEKTHSYFLCIKPMSDFPFSFRELFTVYDYGDRFLIGPKIKSEVPLDDSGRVRIEYANGVIEESIHTPMEPGYFEKRVGVRWFPDGRIDRGAFHVTDEVQQSFKGIRTQQGVTDIYFNPAKLGFEIYLNSNTEQLIDFNEYCRLLEDNSDKAAAYSALFLSVVQESEESARLVALKEETVVCPDSKQTLSCYVPSDISVFEVFLKMLQINGNCFKKVAMHIDLKEFLNFLFTPNDKMNGTFPIFTIDQKAALEVLKAAQENGVEIDLQKIDSNTQETLFSRCASMAKEPKLIQFLLDLEPSAIEQIQTLGKKRSFVSTALMEGNKGVADLLLQAAATRGVILTEKDEWIRKAATNDLSFSDKEFLALDKQFQDEIFGVANTYNCYDFVLRLRGLLNKADDEILHGPSLLCCTMDAVRRREVIQGFLVDLRKKGQLLTSEQFRAPEFSAFKWHDKGYDIGRLLGRNYIEALSKKLGVNVKAPLKVAVLSEKGDSLTLSIVKNKANLGIDSRNFKIYAKDVPERAEGATYEEMVDLVRFLEVSCFNDIHPGNFIIADGIYIIDTEFSNFGSTPAYHQFHLLLPLVAPESREKFSQFLSNKFALLKDGQSKDETSPTGDVEKDYNTFGLTHSKPMTFHVEGIFHA